MTDPLVDNRNRQPSQKGYICDNRRLPRECQDNPPLRLFRDHPNNQLPNNYILWTASLLAWTILSCYCCSVAKSCPTLATPWTRLPYPSLSPWVCWNSCLLTQYLILCHPFLLLPSIFLSIRVFSNELALHSKCPKYWSFNFSISLSNDYLGLISFRIDSCSPRDSQESSPAPQLESINSSALSLLYSQTLTSNIITEKP